MSSYRSINTSQGAFRPTAASIARSVNTPTVARQPASTVQRACPSLIKQATAQPSAPKPRLSPSCPTSVYERIEARKQRVIANLRPATKRPTAPAPIRQPSSVPSRAVVPAAPAPIREASLVPAPSVPIRQSSPVLPGASVQATPTLRSCLKSSTSGSRVIPPPPPSYAERSFCVPTSREDPRMLPNRRYFKSRGNRAYCEARPCRRDGNGNIPKADYKPMAYHGVNCKCHSKEVPTRFWVAPWQWSTTPAEADVDPARRRVVRFERDPVRSTKRLSSSGWAREWGEFIESEDETTEAEDNKAIEEMDNLEPASTSTLPDRRSLTKGSRIPKKTNP